MTASRSGLLAVPVLVLAGALAGCAAVPPSPAPANLAVECTGDGTPTVILIPGLGADSGVFSSLQAQLADDVRVCTYSRAGLGLSPPWPEDRADPSAGMAADQLLATLEEEGEAGPFVVLGWSYGGVVAQAMAFGMFVVLAVMMLLYIPLQRRSQRWAK